MDELVTALLRMAAEEWRRAMRLGPRCWDPPNIAAAIWDIRTNWPGFTFRTEVLLALERSRVYTDWAAALAFPGGAVPVNWIRYGTVDQSWARP